MKIYIAGPFFSEGQVSFVEEIEDALDHMEIEYFSPRSEGTLIDMTIEERESKMVDIFNSNIENMNTCDAMVSIIDGFDTGTMVEVGYFYCLDKPIFTVTENDYGLNIMLRQMATVHNKILSNLMVNLIEHKNNRSLTHFDELTKDVT